MARQTRVPPTRAPRRKKKPAAPDAVPALRVSEIGVTVGLGFAGDADGTAEEKAAAFLATTPGPEITIAFALTDQYNAPKRTVPFRFADDEQGTAAAKATAFLTNEIPAMLAAPVEAAPEPAAEPEPDPA